MLYPTLRYETKPNSIRQAEGHYNTIGISLLKKQLKLEASDTSEDDLLNFYLVSTIKNAEAYTRRVIDLCEWKSYLNGFHDVTLDVHPVYLPSIVVKYFDVDGAEQTLSASLYTVQNNGDDYVKVKFEGGLPSTDGIDEPVYIQYLAGDSVYPEWLIVPVLKRAADEYEIRTGQVNHSLNTVEFNFHRALFPYKML